MDTKKIAEEIARDPQALEILWTALLESGRIEKLMAEIQEAHEDGVSLLKSDRG